MKRTLTLLLLSGVLIACGSNAEEKSEKKAAAKAASLVESINVQLDDANPAQALAILTGNFPDSCTQLESASVEYGESVFTAKLTTSQPLDAACAQIITPFQQILTLDLKGLKAGEYTLKAEGAEKKFTLIADVPQEQEAPKQKPKAKK